MSSSLALLLLLYLLRPKPRPAYHPPPHPPLGVPWIAPGPGTASHPPIVLTHAAAPPPWPSAMPAGLPPFPGPGWIPDSPPPPPVVARAFALLPQLWARGQGASATEQTAGRWITYVARMLGSKRSVIAYRLALPAPVVVVNPQPAAVPATPLLTATAPHAPTAPTTALPTLRLTKPPMKSPSVVYLQRKLQVQDDGVYGPATERAVRAFQATRTDPATGARLKPDGIVGPATWRAVG